MRRCNRSQTNQDEILDNCCQVTFTPKVTLLQLPFFLDTSCIERGSRLLKENF